METKNMYSNEDLDEYEEIFRDSHSSSRVQQIVNNVENLFNPVSSQSTDENIDPLQSSQTDITLLSNAKRKKEIQEVIDKIKLLKKKMSKYKNKSLSKYAKTANQSNAEKRLKLKLKMEKLKDRLETLMIEEEGSKR